MAIAEKCLLISACVSASGSREINTSQSKIILGYQRQMVELMNTATGGQTRASVKVCQAAVLIFWRASTAASALSGLLCVSI